MGLLDGVSGFIKENPLVSTGGALATGVVLGVGTAAIVGKIKSNRGNKRKRKSSRRNRKKHPRHEKRHQHYGYKEVKSRRKRKSKHSRKGLHYTKKGQPYIILASGKAKFVKKTKRRNR
jgi:hypothetical protein